MDPAAYRMSTAHDPDAAKQNTDFSLLWVLIGTVIVLVLQMGPLFALGIDGYAGLFLGTGVCFLGGILIAFLSPGRTYVEALVAALISTIATNVFLAMTTPEGLGPVWYHYAFGTVIAALFGLFGARLGEAVQSATRGHKA